MAQVILLYALVGIIRIKKSDSFKGLFLSKYVCSFSDVVSELRKESEQMLIPKGGATLQFSWKSKSNPWALTTFFK